jgi:hypothetical protein
MAPTRVLTKRLYINYNGGNNNVSLDWTNAYNAYPFGSAWSPPSLKLELLAPSNEPVLYSAQNLNGGGAYFINGSDVVYQPVNGSSYPVALTNPYLANSLAYNNANGNFPFYNYGSAWANDFAQTNAL